jgi:hypothetical protein
MRRAYPQFMTAGGERLPREILTVIFRLCRDLIRQLSWCAARPYLVAGARRAGITFVRDVK